MGFGLLIFDIKDGTDRTRQNASQLHRMATKRVCPTPVPPTYSHAEIKFHGAVCDLVNPSLEDLDFLECARLEIESGSTEQHVCAVSHRSYLPREFFFVSRSLWGGGEGEGGGGVRVAKRKKIHARSSAAFVFLWGGVFFATGIFIVRLI